MTSTSNRRGFFVRVQHSIGMFKQSQAIELELQAQGWTMTLSGCSHGITITACKHAQQITVYHCSYCGAWQALAEEIRKQTGENTLS